MTGWRFEVVSERWDGGWTVAKLRLPDARNSEGAAVVVPLRWRRGESALTVQEAYKLAVRFAAEHADELKEVAS